MAAITGSTYEITQYFSIYARNEIPKTPLAFTGCSNSISQLAASMFSAFGETGLGEARFGETGFGGTEFGEAGVNPSEKHPLKGPKSQTYMTIATGNN